MSVLGHVVHSDSSTPRARSHLMLGRRSRRAFPAAHPCVLRPTRALVLTGKSLREDQGIPSDFVPSPLTGVLASPSAGAMCESVGGIVAVFRIGDNIGRGSTLTRRPHQC